MIGTVNVRCNAAKPNFPLQPLFAFQGSPSSIRILDVPKSIGNWTITSVKVAVTYPSNMTIEKAAVRTGSVWVSTIGGCDNAGKVSNGYEIIADGIDEDGNAVTGYVLGKGDVYVIENDTDIARLLDKYTVRYLDDIPDNPTTGDLMNSNGQLRLFDGVDWILIQTGQDTGVYDSEITISANGTPVGSFTVNQSVAGSIDIPVPSNVSELNNDVGYITASEVPPVPSNLSDYNNDVGYITASAVPSKVSELDNDAGYITASAIPAIPSKVSELDNDAGYLTASASAITNLDNSVSAISTRLGEVAASVETLGTSVSALTTSMSGKRDLTDLVYKVGFDKNNLDKVVKFVVEYVDGNNQNVTATLDKYDEFTQTWTGDNTNWRVYTFLVGMEAELYFALNDGTNGQDDQPAPSQGAEDTSWNFTYNGSPATWTMVMTQNIALQQDFKNLRSMKDISYPASVDSTGMYTIQKFNVSGTEVAHFTTSGSTSTWDTNDPVVNTYEISTTDGTNFTLVSGGIQIGTFTMTSLKNGVVDVTYDGNTYTVGATFKQTTFALKDYVDQQIGSVLTEQM